MRNSPLSLAADAFWWILARVANLPWVRDRLFERSTRTPYTGIYSADGKRLYMMRWWLFNPYPGSDQADLRQIPWLHLSVRIHHIVRADEDRHLHDHPWNARTVILDGWYDELGEDGVVRHRAKGYTGRLNFGQYHRITQVSDRGALTLFVTFRYGGTWGFLVDGKKVPWREYLGITK